MEGLLTAFSALRLVSKAYPSRMVLLCRLRKGTSAKGCDFHAASLGSCLPIMGILKR